MFWFYRGSFNFTEVDIQTDGMTELHTL